MTKRKSFFKHLVSLVLLAVLLLSSTACSEEYWEKATPEEIAAVLDVLDAYEGESNFIFWHSSGITLADEGRYIHNADIEQDIQGFEFLYCDEKGVYSYTRFTGEEPKDSFKIFFQDYETLTPTLLMEAPVPEGGHYILSVDGNFYIGADDGARGPQQEKWYYLCDTETGTYRRIAKEEEPNRPADSAFYDHGDATYYAHREDYTDAGFLQWITYGVMYGSRIVVSDRQTGVSKTVDASLYETCPVLVELRDMGLELRGVYHPYVKEGEVYLCALTALEPFDNKTVSIVLRYDFASETLHYHGYFYHDEYKGDMRDLIIL